jgi:hypothetical protein
VEESDCGIGSDTEEDSVSGSDEELEIPAIIFRKKDFAARTKSKKSKAATALSKNPTLLRKGFSKNIPLASAVPQEYLLPITETKQKMIEQAQKIDQLSDTLKKFLELQQSVLQKKEEKKLEKRSAVEKSPADEYRQTVLKYLSRS